MIKLSLGYWLFDLSAPSSVEMAIFIVSIFLGHPVSVIIPIFCNICIEYILSKSYALSESTVWWLQAWTLCQCLALLDLRQEKNDWITWRNSFVLKFRAFSLASCTVSEKVRQFQNKQGNSVFLTLSLLYSFFFWMRSTMDDDRAWIQTWIERALTF